MPIAPVPEDSSEAAADSARRATVLFFGPLAERLGRSRSIGWPDGVATIGDLRKSLAAADPAAGVLLDPGVKASVDRVVAPDDTVIGPEREIAFFPVFSGG